MELQETAKLKLTGNIAMYRNALNSGHKIDHREWQSKRLIKRIKEMNTDLCTYTKHPALKYLSIKDHRIIKSISLN